MANNLVFGVGFNDGSRKTEFLINGVRSRCPYYVAWKRMLERCYSKSSLSKNPCYLGCSVSEDWLNFSNFMSWMKAQDWKGKHLDKDILIPGNKIYSADTCVFVDQATNKFTTDRAAGRGEWPIGVCFHKKRNLFQANCRNGFTDRLEYLGLFSTPEGAHLAWRKRKHELACQLADLQTDDRVAAALRIRYL
jgi:hypothetical protein